MIKKENGQALLIVITVLALLFTVGMAFFTISQAERSASVRNLDSLRARYIAEAGVAYALKALKLDRQTNLIDSPEDMKSLSGEDVDLNGDGKAESRWFNMLDSQGLPCGRFSVKVSDEASKVNFNAAQAQQLKQLFSRLGIDTSKADTVLGKRPFNAVEELGSILDKKDFALAKDLLTVYSCDWEVDLERKRRSYLNSSSAQVMLEEFLAAGIKEPHQKAANLKDASDLDLCQTQLDKFSKNNIAPTQLIEAGSWVKRGDFYEAVGEETLAPGKFTWSNLPVEDGGYFCYLYAPSDKDVIGEAYLEGEGEERLSELLFSGEGLMRKVTVTGGSFSLNIRPVKLAKGQRCRFSHIELASPEPKNGLAHQIIRGTEALVINEIMVKLSQDILIDTPADISPGHSFRHTFTKIKPGNYYLTVLAKNMGGLVGDVEIYGRVGEGLYGGDYFPATAQVGSDGALTVQIKNNSLGGNASFKGIKVLQEPDAEFIEILNISAQQIDLSNFSFEVYSSKGDFFIPGWPARIPQGTKIEPYQHLVFTADNSDTLPAPAQLRANDISFKEIWGFNGVGLIFDEYLETLDKTFDLLPDKAAIVVLKDNLGRQVDRVEYKESQVKDFVSLERADPSAKTTGEDENGVFDGWYASENVAGATAGATNENTGMYTRDENNNLILHSPSQAVVFNNKLSNLAQVMQLSDGRNWKKFSLSDVSRIADHFAYEAAELILAGNYKTGEFKEKDGAFESLHKNETGIWEFSKIPAGNYLLNIISDNLTAEGENVQVAYKTDKGAEFKDFSVLLFSQGIAPYGMIELKQDTALELKIINDSEKKITLRNIKLEPVNSVMGRININTAGADVLGSILGSDMLASIILENRPFGAKDNRKLGIGELLLLEPAFLSFHNHLTVKSDVFEIFCRGEYSPAGKTMAYQNIRTVLERGE